MPRNHIPENGRRPLLARALDAIEKLGNKLPDPAVLFLLLLFAVWAVSALLDGLAFQLPGKTETQRVQSQLTGSELAGFLSGMVETFTGFKPLGVVLVALLGVGVAEHSGFIHAALKRLLAFTPRRLLTPMLLVVAIISHTAADCGYVLVIPLGGVLFYTAGRHPLAGIAAAFAGVSGGFGANFIVSALDPLLQGITQEAAAIVDPSRQVNPLCNLLFTALSSPLIVAIGWFLTDRVIEPRLAGTPVDGDPREMPVVEEVTPAEERGLYAGLVVLAAAATLLVIAASPEDSPLRSHDPTTPGSLTAFSAPLMKSIVPLIFIFFLLPGIACGYASGKFKSHRDVIEGMSRAMGTMGYYLVMAFFASLFIEAFRKSNLGALLAVTGADFLRELALPPAVTVVGVILVCTAVNLVVGSASAKWALLAPIFVPMLMQLRISPELTQAAYRIGDSTTNIVTPLMPYFPLVVSFARRYYRGTGIGTMVSLMLPYSLCFIISWTAFLLIYWALGIPLGVQGVYTYEG
jgi:aminobenzoyl-glutamate transport protein